MHLTDSNEWKPSVHIGWTTPDTLEFFNPTITGTFPTKAEAEREALLFAKNWIESNPQLASALVAPDEDRPKMHEKTDAAWWADFWFYAAVSTAIGIALEAAGVVLSLE